MSNKILYSPKEGTTGFWGLRDVPTQPNEDDYKRHRAPGLNDFIRAESDYIKALESCKSNKLEIVNPEVTGVTVYDLSLLKPGDIFDIPQGYQFKEECIIQESTGEWVLTHEDMYNRFPEDRRKRVLRLVKTETKDKLETLQDFTDAAKRLHKAVAKLEPEPEESQTVLVDKLIKMVEATAPDYLKQSIMQSFTIQRKKQ